MSPSGNLKKASFTFFSLSIKCTKIEILDIRLKGIDWLWSNTLKNKYRSLRFLVVTLGNYKIFYCHFFSSCFFFPISVDCGSFLLNTNLVKMVSPSQLCSINTRCHSFSWWSKLTVKWQAAIFQQVNDWADDKWPFYHCNQCLLFGKQNDTVCIFQQTGQGISPPLTCEFVTWVRWISLAKNVNFFELIWVLLL